MLSIFYRDGAKVLDAGLNADQQNGITKSHRVPPALLRSRNFYRFFVLALTFGTCTLFYYFGQLIDLEGWASLRWGFFYDVHDVDRLLFLVPITYAGYFFGFRAMLAVTAASLAVFLPRAIFISPFPNALPRALLFAMVPFVLYPLVRMRHDTNRTSKVEAMAVARNNGLVEVQESTEDGVLSAGEVEVDLSRRLVKRHGQIVKLTPMEYKLFKCLVRNCGKVMTTRELLHKCWGPEFGQESEYVRNFISQLRHKIEDDPSNPQLIMTEPRFGYRFLEPESTLNNHPS